MPTQPGFDAAFWAQVMADAHRTIFCAQADFDRVTAAVEARGIAGLVTVTPSNVLEPGQLYLSDDGAAERLIRRPCRYQQPSTHPVRPGNSSPDPLPQTEGTNLMNSTTLDLDQLRLLPGGHRDRNDGVCLLEAVAWWAGEPHSARPACVSRVLAGFGMSLNDRFDTERRQELKRFIPLLPGTADDGQDEARSYLALDWLIRTYTPAWLDLAGLTAEAAELRALRRIVDLAAAQSAGPVVRAARTKAAAAWAAAWAAAGAAAWAAAWAAAGAAAWAAAWAAARAALKPTVDQLQTSVIALFESMVNPAAAVAGE